MRLLLAALLLAALALSGCSPRETPAAAGLRTRTLLVGNSAEPADLDPHLASILSDQILATALFEGLTVLDERTTAPLPAAAESWSVSPDGLVWTFRLRDGLRWSDGDPLVAADFVASIHRVLHPAFASDNAWYLFPLVNAEAFNAGRLADPAAVGARAPDPRTLVLTLAQPTPYLPALVSMPAWFPVNPRVVSKFQGLEKRGTAWTRPGQLVGNGPFVLAEWRPQARILVRKNPHHRDAAATRLDAIAFHPVSSPDVEERDFRAGQLHVTFTLPVTKIAAWRRDDPARLRVDPTSQINFLRFNVTRPPLDRPEVRRALSLVIDRERLARTVLQGSRAPAVAFTPPATGGYTARAAVATDVAAARRLLAAAGFPEGRGFPALELQCRNDEIMPRLAEALQAVWRTELGIQISITQLEQKTWVQNMQQLTYAISTAAWTADFPDPVTFLGLFAANSAYNWTGWKQPAYDRLLDRAAATGDAAARFELLQQAEALLLEELPATPLHLGAQTYLIHPAVKNWHPSPLVFRRFQLVELAP